ncbi:Cna B-type domain-containing protein [Bacillus sp. S10(2024)]|uniref:Cna B-type domain-containing protein n=1 Tax=Bacillus sp. S10(2024) TaxID=3162886 RepID=UPI003D1B9DD4
MPIIVNAQELNTAGFVDSFTIKQNLQSGEQTKVTINFSEKNGFRLKSGDTLTLTLPPELTGLNTTFNLNDYGTCTVTNGTVVCTFNDKVSEYQNIKGYLNFRVQADNVGTDQKKEIETNFGTTVAKQAITITGPTSGGGTDPGERPFFYKTGDMNSGNDNEVRWFLNINLNREKLKNDITVTDNLQEGQKLNKDSFYIIVDDGIDRKSISFQDFQDNYGTITFTGDTSFKVVIPKDKANGNSFSIGYTSTITEAGKKQDFFKNDYQIDYQVADKQPVSDSGTYPVENMSAGGGASGDVPSKGTLKIVKHLEGSEEKVIPNVSFNLYKDSGEKVGGQYTTDEKGIIEIKDLTPGKYYVQEVSAPNYIDFDPQAKVEFEVKSDTVNGIKLPISNRVKTTSITGMKTWKDDNQNRPKAIKVDLYQNEKVVDTKEVSEATGWKYEFENLAAYDTDGKEYKYEVKEQPVAGYESKVNGYDITNTKVGKTSVAGTKTWKGGTEEEHKAIKVDLLQNGQVIDTKEVSEATNWMYKFDNLQAYDVNGVAYKYEVKEKPVPGYESKVDGFNITNTKVGEVNVEGTKTWNDGNATDRPSSVKVDLYQNDTFLLTQYVTAANDWKYTFADLAAYDANGKAYKYEVKEQPVAGYESKVNGYDITNTKVGETKVEGTKTWKDDNAKDRPAMIKVDLLQNNKVVDTKEVTAATDWKYTFEKLQAYDANGVAYKYTVKEQPVDGYKTEVRGYDITNTKVGETKVEGTKTWKDDNAKDRPKMIKVDLLQNGTVIATQEVTAEKGWKYEFKDLAAYDVDGKAYKYEVKEQPVDGYKTEVKGYDITNTKIREWTDEDPKDPSKGPNIDPKDPNTNSDTKVPSNKENDKTTVLLPKTGGTPAEMISIVGGMILFVLGGMLFARQQMKQ